MDGIATRRPVWMRIAQFPPLRLLVLGGVLFWMLAVSNGLMGRAAGPLQGLAAVAAMAALGFAVYAGFVRLVERRRVRELSLPGMAPELGAGLAIGAGLYAACVVILMLAGIYRIEGVNPWWYLLPALPMALNSGIFEELLFRGALFRILEEWLGSWVSLVVSSLVFGMVHLINPTATLMGAIFISVEAGILLAAAYMLTRRLWMSMGFHVAWNYVQSGVYSGIVSGADADPGLLKSTIEGPVVLTGGQFGLESSVVAFLLCTTTGVILLMMAVRKGHMVKPFWTRNRRG